MLHAWEGLHSDATILLAYLLVIVVVFLIARVARAGQSLALLLAATPVLVAITAEVGVTMGLI